MKKEYQRLEIWEREKLCVCGTSIFAFANGFINSATFARGNSSAEASPWSCHTSGDENDALRPAHNFSSPPRDEISLLSLSLVSHENHRRRRLLECRSPLLLHQRGSSIILSCSFFAFTTVSAIQPPVSPPFLVHRSSVFSRSLSCRCIPAVNFPLCFPPRRLEFNGGESPGMCAASLDEIYDSRRRCCKRRLEIELH